VEARLNNGGNAGVLFRTEAAASVLLNKEGTRIPAGYEADLNLAASQQAQAGTLWRTGIPVRIVKKSLIQPEKWFAMEVLAQDQNVVVKVNGEEVVSYVETDEDLFRQGHIGLQIAWPEVSRVEFRKIEVKELPAIEKSGTPLAKNRLTEDHLAQGEVRRINRRSSSFVTQLRVSTDGDSLFTASEDGFMQLLPLKTGGKSQTMQYHTTSLDAFAVSVDGTRLLAGYQDGTIVLWEGSPFAVKRKLLGHTGSVRGLAFTSDGGRAVSCSADWQYRQDSTVRLWNVETGDEVHQFNCRNFANLSVSISPDDHQVLVGAQLVNSRGRAALFNLESGQLDREFPGFYSDVWHVDFSPDGSRALTTHMALAEIDGLWDDPENCVVRLWDVITGMEVCLMRGHRSGVLCAAFSPDGKYVVSGSGPQHDTSGRFKEASDRSVRIWDAETGAELQSFRCEKPPIGVAFARDGRSAFSAGGEPYIREWKVSTPGLE
jgi:WD40 repeat protein